MENNLENNNKMQNNNINEQHSLVQDFIDLITKKLQNEKQDNFESGEQDNCLNDNEHKNTEQQLQETQTTTELQKEKILVIDRFEGDYAVCENRETLLIENIELSKLPKDIKEGDVLKYKDNQYELDVQAKTEIELRIQEKMKDIFNT